MTKLKFIVLSDLHLGLPGGVVNGLDTDARLAAAIETINRDHANADFVLLAGDLADRGETEAYVALRRHLAALQLPFHITLGNHDDRERFLSVWGHELDDPEGRVSQVIDRGGHRVILLDSSEPGLVAGRLCQGRRDWLAARLDEAADRPVIVVLHHNVHALSIEADNIILEDGAAFAEILKRHPDIRMVIAGHVHIPTISFWHGLPMMTLAGSHYSMGLHLPGMNGRELRLEGPAQLAVVLADDEGVVVHLHDYLQRHVTLAPGLFRHG